MADNNNELQLVVQESGLPENKVSELMAQFGEDFSLARKVVAECKDIVVTDETQTEQMQKARTARLNLKNIRVSVENNRKRLKEQSLREGKAIDGAANIIKALIAPVEEHLEKQEKFAEEMEAKRKAEKLEKRREQLQQYVSDISVYDLENISNETFEKLLADAKVAFEAQKEAERKAEEERIAKEKAEAEEQERIRKENEELKKKQEEQEKILAEERRKAAEEKEKQDEILRKEREEKEKLEAKIKADKEAAEKKAAEEKAAAEKKEREEREAAEKEAAEKAEAEKKKLLAPDRDKILELAKVVENVELPTVQSDEAKAAVQRIYGKFAELETLIRQEADNL